jgi:hypothetical protein
LYYSSGSLGSGECGHDHSPQNRTRKKAQKAQEGMMLDASDFHRLAPFVLFCGHGSVERAFTLVTISAKSGFVSLRTVQVILTL